MGLFIIALIIVIALQIKDRKNNNIVNFIVGLFGMFVIMLILTGLLNICLEESVPQKPHLIRSTKTSLRSFEDGVFLISSGDYVNYLVDTEAGIEMRSEPISHTTIHFTEGEPCKYVQRYTYKNPILNFMVFNMITKTSFYIPEESPFPDYVNF